MVESRPTSPMEKRLRVDSSFVLDTECGSYRLINEMSAREHTISSIYIARVSCSCGWSFVPEKVNHVKDEDLQEQLAWAHEEHRRGMIKKYGGKK